jgi:hypothetical protein
MDFFIFPTYFQGFAGVFIKGYLGAWIIASIEQAPKTSGILREICYAYPRPNYQPRITP